MKIPRDDDILHVAVAAARAAGALLRERFGRAHRIEYKGWRNIVTEVDHGAQAIVIRHLSKKYPDHGVVAEERDNPMVRGDEARCRWFIDPLDGTTNYAHGYPSFCVSIGFAVDGRIRVGVVFDPLHEELFTASVGRGARLNGKPIHVSRIGRLSRSLTCTGFSYETRWARVNLVHFKNFIHQSHAVRRAGSAALDLCFVAAGRLDGFWELRLNPWDVAAGALIVEEAGGKVTDFAGGPYDIYGKQIVASNGRIHPPMLRLITRGVRELSRKSAR